MVVAVLKQEWMPCVFAPLCLEIVMQAGNKLQRVILVIWLVSSKRHSLGRKNLINAREKEKSFIVELRGKAASREKVRPVRGRVFNSKLARFKAEKVFSCVILVHLAKAERKLG